LFAWCGLLIARSLLALSWLALMAWGAAEAFTTAHATGFRVGNANGDHQQNS
jgi:hypothetical protein